MRTALLAIVLAAAACGGAPQHPTTLPPVAANPANDLTQTQRAGGVTAPDRRAGTGDVARTPQPIDLDVVRMEVHGHDAHGDPNIEASAPGPLLLAGNTALAAKQYEDALAQYRKIVSDFPDSKAAPVAMYNIALVYEAEGRIDDAIQAYRDLVKTYPTGRDSLDGHMRIAALQAEHEKWKDAEATLTAILARTDLEHSDRIEALAREGYVQLSTKQLDAAEKTLEDAVDVWHRAQHIDDPYFVAMADYYLGEIAHQRFLDAPMRLPRAQLEKDITAKEALAVAAYDRWKGALQMRNAYWATASGYQMSQIFYELWQSAVAAPTPETVDASAKDAYVAEVHKLVRDDLDKALDGHRMNVQLAAAYGVSTAWSEASKQKAAEILEVIQRESTARASAP
jgi:tetratricopeptide (TPR) repeat protein